jgi:hypothetical protein
MILRSRVLSSRPTGVSARWAECPIDAEAAAHAFDQNASVLPIL